MIAYFYAGACNRAENLQSVIINQIRGNVGQIYDPPLLIETAREIQDFYYQKCTQKLGGEQATYDRMLEIIRRRLCLQSSEDAQRAYATLFGYSEACEEHKVVVILACTLLEKLFDDLLVLLYTSKGVGHAEAEEKVSRLRGFDERCRRFKKYAGLSLEDAIGQCSIPVFFSNWEEVRDKRNKFVHGNPFAIGVDWTEKAFNLAKNAFSVFAWLQNRFCLRQTAE